jgi:ribonuclease Z
MSLRTKIGTRARNNTNYQRQVQKFFQETLQIDRVETVQVRHSFPSYALVFEHKEWGKVVYSGDTRPCDELVEAGKNAQLLIHVWSFFVTQFDWIIIFNLGVQF